ncbi:hypothetical protein GCM10010244_23720 [Streptomyces coeruleorubidus]|nr:hypothetical protein GCM10010244_23720 [Streptomyces bellus]
MGTQVMVSLVPMASATLTVSQVVVALELTSVSVVVIPVTAIAVVLAATTTPATKPATAEDVRAMEWVPILTAVQGGVPGRPPWGWEACREAGGGGGAGPACQEVTENPLKTASMFSPG